jgi:NAD+ diphosphatase
VAGADRFGGANAFTGARLDRAADARKDPAWVAAQREHPGARAVLAGDAGVHIAESPAGPRLALVPLAQAPGRDHWLLLGLDEHGPVFAVDVDDADGAVPRPLIGAHGTGEPDPATGTRAYGLRDAVTELPRADGGLIAYASALVNWHRRHGHCSVCGAATEPALGGLVRECPACGSHHFPRTDPVVIMLVTDGRERLLLGRQASWPAGRYSALAGFVEPGETLEEAVVREVREEAGIEVGPPAYVSSQPWPFPASLMLGFSAPWQGGEPVRQEDEIEDVRWFTRDEVAAAAAADRVAPTGATTGAEPVAGIRLPPRHAIARRLVDGWLEG